MIDFDLFHKFHQELKSESAHRLLRADIRFHEKVTKLLDTLDTINDADEIADDMINTIEALREELRRNLSSEEEQRHRLVTDLKESPLDYPFLRTFFEKITKKCPQATEKLFHCFSKTGETLNDLSFFQNETQPHDIP